MLRPPSQPSMPLVRDCSAVQIPYGNMVTLREGTEVHIKQALGDTITLQTAHGYMVRIEAHDADALGEAYANRAKTPERVKNMDAKVEEQMLWDVLRTCYDPEIPANIVDLGLIYHCRIAAEPAGETPAAKGVRVEVAMTLTAPGCGMGDVLQEDVRRKISDVDGVREVDVSLVFEPPWQADMMSESARLELGMF